MGRAWGLMVLAVGGCYAAPAKHKVGDVSPDGDVADVVGDFDSGQSRASAWADASLSDGQDPEGDRDAGDAQADAQPDAGPRCSCTDPDQPICIEATGRCVQCRDENDCGADKHCLVATGQCVGCLDSVDCAGRAQASFCAPATHGCTGCRDGVDADCSNVPGLNVCQAGTCVQCAGTRRDACGEATAGCSASFSCEGCKADADCKRFGKVCDEGTGGCVACTVDSEGGQCGGKSCDLAAHACTQTDRASVDVCSRCVADSECKTDHRCIPMTFKGASRGGYCMKRVSGGCSEPFGAAPLRRVSLSGSAAEDYCGIVEATTSCEAVLALLAGRTCAAGEPARCAADGAVCGNVNGLTPPRCSYACEASVECPASIPCPVSGSDKYCGKI